jgi:GT2 family glycosyltransferase/glycosyltransferase involved in cell wall biosynthesis
MLQDRRSLKDLGDSSGSTGRAVAEGSQSFTDGRTSASSRDGRVELARLRRRLRVRQEELESLQRRLNEIEDSQAWRTILRVRPLIQVFAPPGSLRRRVILRILSWGYSILGARPTRILTAPLRWPTRIVRRLRRPRSRSKRSAASESGVRRLRAGCYGEHSWSVGGGAVHVLKFALALTDFYDVDLLLPRGAPLRDKKWYTENLNIDIGDIEVKSYAAGAENKYDIWISAANERIVFAKTPKSFNIVFFPFVAQNGEGITHIANSNYTARHVKERYGTQDVIVIYPSIAPDDFPPGLKEPLILHVSRFSLPSAFADKAHVGMIQAFKQLCLRGLEGWRLVLVGATLDPGEAVYASHLATHASGYPIEIRPNLSFEELRELYSRASIYWHATGFSVSEPAAQEHFGLTIVEAMAAGAVPIAFNSGGPPETITHGKNGFLFNNAEELIDLTWETATQPALWKKLSQGARRRAYDFSDEVMKDRLLATVSKAEKVSIIIGTRNNCAFLRRALETLFEHTPPGFELIVVNNASEDGTPILLQSLAYPHMKVINNRANRGFAAFNNQGLRLATRPYVLFLNDDVELTPGWLEPLIEMLDMHPKVGAVGSRLLYPDGRIQHDGKMFLRKDLLPQHVNIGGPPGEDERPVEVDTLTGACLIGRRELVGFSEDYRRGYYEDTDMCLRIKERGYGLVLHRGSVVIHHHGISMGRNQKATEEAQTRNKRIFLERWSAKLPSLVHLATESELARGKLRSQAILPAGTLTETWPLSQRMRR